MKFKKTVFVISVMSLVSIAALAAYDYLRTPEESEFTLATQNMNYSIASDNSARLPVSQKQSHIIDDIDIIKQKPELPTGCEVTSLTMVLKYMGFSADKVKISREFLEKQDIIRDEENKLYGPDFTYIFPGNPEDEMSYGCLAPCITDTAQKYLKSQSSLLKAQNISGTDFYELFTYISEDIPVILWSTQDLKEPVYKTSWKVYDSDYEVTWPTNEHCVVLTGYDYTDNTVTINDPLKGKQRLEMESVKERYNQIGKNAVVISE